MHLSPQLLPNPLGDADAAIRARVFGPRMTPGLTSSAPTGVAGGDLGGTYPNPTVTPENASLLLAHRAFLPHSSTGVLSVGLSLPPALFSVSGSPVTGSGTLTGTLTSVASPYVLAGPAATAGPLALLLLAPEHLASAVFVAAGGSHKAGAVPDPGATSHSNQPYYLGDAAAWVKPKGRLLGSLSVSTDESTASLTYVDLTTVDTITFSLDVTSDVLVEYTCQVYNTVVANNSLQIMLDGTAQTATAITFTMTVANSGFAAHLDYVLTGLASGSHTVKVQKAVSSGTGHYKVRTLRAWLAG